MSLSVHASITQPNRSWTILVCVKSSVLLEAGMGDLFLVCTPKGEEGWIALMFAMMPERRERERRGRWNGRGKREAIM